MSFSFGELLDDIGPWLIFGAFLAGIIGGLISPEFVQDYLGSGFIPMLLMLVLATPLYVCATASTPIAAALVLKGLSPGAALVFLMAGPATNVATIMMVSKLLGKRSAAIYVGSILICTLVFGGLVNYGYGFFHLSVIDWQGTVLDEPYGPVSYLSAGILLVLMARGLIARLLKRLAIN